MHNQVLITGGAGMIGSHLIDELLAASPGTKILVLDNFSVGQPRNIPESPRILIVQGNVRDKVLIESLVVQSEAVYHLATLKKGNDLDSSLETLDTIVDSARLVLDACLKYNRRLILASTSDVYGYGVNLPFNESDPVSLGPFNTRRWAYAVAKLYTEQLAYEYFRKGVDVRLIRYFGGFSERSSMTWSGGHIPLFIYNTYHGNDIVIHGDGMQTRCVTHGSDLAKGTLLVGITEGIEGELFNIGSEEEITVKAAAERILTHFPNSRSKMRFIDTDEIFGTYKEIERRRPSLEKSREMLGYRPSLSFDEGIEILIRQLECESAKETSPS